VAACWLVTGRIAGEEDIIGGVGESVRAALNPTLALVSVCGDISPSLQVMNLEFLQ
jgi:hypothetical protein